MVVGTPNFTAVSLFGLQFHGGLKTIHIDPQCSIEFGELPIGEFTNEAIIAHHLPHNLPIFLLDIALVETLVVGALW